MRYDVIVVGAGPNGLSAAIRMAQAGRSVLLREASNRVGGAVRTEELTLPGFLHDPCSAVYPMGIGSPFFRTLPLGEHGLEWVHPDAPLAHPFDDGSAALLERSLERTAATLGDTGAAYVDLMRPLVENWEELAAGTLKPLGIPAHPLLLARFGVRAMRSAEGVAKRVLGGGRAGALLAGSSAHAGIPLNRLATASYGMMLNAAGHAVGWPFPRGGAGRLAEALASYFRSLGGEIMTDAPVRALKDLPPSRAVILDLTARQVAALAETRLPRRYRRALQRFRYGVGAFKVDWALSGPIPWRASECARAGTVHLGGSLAQVIESEEQPWERRYADRPLVLLAQPSLFDPTRAPEGMHTAWGYCHVPNGSNEDMTARVEAQVERFAPGFRDLVVGQSTLSPRDLERMDGNLVGGDVNGGAGTIGQLFTRPMVRANPYSTPVRGLYICSASTPPGGGVHGMCGYHAAEAVLADGF